ncbi:hypothetical protein A6A27_15635 [Micromonospora sp. CB01531]|nr:hypothetical protein A6A27_15635 [Micromonospora sp. CB01531]
MTVKTEAPTRAAGARPFTTEIPEAELDALRARIRATRWPEKQTVDDQSRGVPLETSQALARYWEQEYDWRKVEARLNALPNFIDWSLVCDQFEQGAVRVPEVDTHALTTPTSAIDGPLLYLDMMATKVGQHLFYGAGPDET